MTDDVRKDSFARGGQADGWGGSPADAMYIPLQQYIYIYAQWRPEMRVLSRCAASAQRICLTLSPSRRWAVRRSGGLPCLARPPRANYLEPWCVEVSTVSTVSRVCRGCVEGVSRECRLTPMSRCRVCRGSVNGDLDS